MCIRDSNTTEFPPKAEKLKDVSLKTIVSIEQLSNDPLFTIAAVTLANPEEFRYTVKF